MESMPGLVLFMVANSSGYQPGFNASTHRNQAGTAEMPCQPLAKDSLIFDTHRSSSLPTACGKPGPRSVGGKQQLAPISFGGQCDR